MSNDEPTTNAGSESIPAEPTQETSSTSGFSIGKIIGIVIAAVAIAGAVLAFTFWQTMNEISSRGTTVLPNAGSEDAIPESGMEGDYGDVGAEMERPVMESTDDEDGETVESEASTQSEEPTESEASDTELAEESPTESSP